MNTLEKIRELRRLLALVMAITTAPVVAEMLRQPNGDNGNTDEMNNKFKGLSLANASMTNLLTISSAKADSIEDAMVEQMIEAMKREYGKVIADKDSLRKLYLYANNLLTDEEEIKQMDKLSRVIIGLNVNPGTEGFFYLSDIIGDEYLSSELRTMEDLCRTLKTSKDDKDEEAFMDYVENTHNADEVYFGTVGNKFMTTYEAYAGSLYLERGDSVKDDSGRDIPWTGYESADGNITYTWSGKRKGYEAYDENDERISGTLYSSEQMISKQEKGEVIKVGILADVEFRLNGLDDIVMEPCQEQPKGKH